MKIFLVSSSLQNKPIYIGNQSERRWNVYKRSTTIEYVLVALQSEKDGTVGGSGESYKMPSKQLSGRRELTYIYIFNIYFFFYTAHTLECSLIDRGDMNIQVSRSVHRPPNRITSEKRICNQVGLYFFLSVQ